MNYDEITKITAERISDYMTEAVNTDSKAVAFSLSFVRVPMHDNIITA